MVCCVTMHCCATLGTLVTVAFVVSCDGWTRIGCAPQLRTRGVGGAMNGQNWLNGKVFILAILLASLTCQGGIGMTNVGSGTMSGVLFLVTRWCSRFVTRNTHLAVGLFKVSIGGNLVMRGIVIIGASSITLCSALHWAVLSLLVTLCSLQGGAGCNKSLIFWVRYQSSLFPYGVVLACGISSTNSSVSARRCWCSVMSGSWQCCGNSSVDPDVR